MAAGRMVLLTTVADPLTARILAAHLGAEGVVWQLRGNVDGPYPVGPVEVLVEEEDLDHARLVLDTEPVDAADEPVPGEAGVAASRVPARVGPWLMLLVIGVPLLLAIVRLLGHLL